MYPGIKITDAAVQLTAAFYLSYLRQLTLGDLENSVAKHVDIDGIVRRDYHGLSGVP